LVYLFVCLFSVSPFPQFSIYVFMLFFDSLGICALFLHFVKRVHLVIFMQVNSSDQQVPVLLYRSICTCGWTLKVFAQSVGDTKYIAHAGEIRMGKGSGS
jgi:hypothetical protein